MPLLAALFAAIGIFGGYVVTVQLIGVDEGAFWSQMQASVDLHEDVVNGIIKSGVFGVAVTWIAVFEGYERCRPRRAVARDDAHRGLTPSLRSPHRFLADSVHAEGENDDAGADIRVGFFVALSAIMFLAQGHGSPRPRPTATR
jgi:hypothetical protein